MSEVGKRVDILLPQIRELIDSARHTVARSVNTLQVITNYEIGRLIVEHEQEGAERAAYGTALLKELASSLTTEFGRGFSVTNLKLMRQFYQANRQQISQTPSDLLHSF